MKRKFFCLNINNLYVNKTPVQQAVGNSLVNISQYSPGSYNVTIILAHANYTGNATKWLYIQNMSPPQISFAFSESYLNTTTPEYFHEDLRIDCRVSDTSSISKVFLRENSEDQWKNRSMSYMGAGKWRYILDISSLGWGVKFNFSFYANDSHGNIGTNDNSSNLYTAEIYDFQKPSITIVYIKDLEPNIVNISTNFTLVFSDGGGSGVQSISYNLNGTGWASYNGPFNLTFTGYGNYTISYYAVDHTGNIGGIYAIKVEILAPSIPIENIIITIGIIGGISVVSVILILKKVKKNPI